MLRLLLQCSKSTVNFNNKHCKISTQRNLQAIRKFSKNEEVKKFRSYIVTRYLEYVQSYEKVVEKKFPTAMHLYRTFKLGMREFYKDLVNYVKIIRTLNSKQDGLKSLTLKEIEIYHKMPKDMLKVAPVLLLSALPLTNYFIFPLAYFYPRQFLCSHFWTIQQRSEFQLHDLKMRLLYHRPTFRCLQAELDNINDCDIHNDWADILGLIGSGVQPSTEQIIACKELFGGKPYSLHNLKPFHVNNLLKMHNLHGLWFRRSRLREHAKVLQAMDKAIVRQGGVMTLNQDALRTACFLRGFNPANVRHEDLTDWLNQWLQVSNNVNHKSLSLLLHCPILLGYNQPSNWLLIY